MVHQDSLVVVLAEVADVHGDAAGVILTVILIACCWFLSRKFPGKELGRKILHIGVSNFGFLYYFVFDGDLLAALGLAIFAVINLVIALRARSKRMGTVIFPISILLMMGLKDLGVGSRLCVAVSTLCMGWGDGLACLFGRRFGKTHMPLSKDKTVVGFVSLMVVVFVFVTCFFGLEQAGSGWGRIVLFALLGSILGGLAECYTPWGMDNLSFPLVVYLLCSLI